MQNGDNEGNKEGAKTKDQNWERKLVVDVTRLHHGCRLLSDWLYIPTGFQHSEGNTHNAQQEREGKLRLYQVITVHQDNTEIIQVVTTNTAAPAGAAGAAGAVNMGFNGGQ